MSDKPKARRGFAAMSPEKRQELARKGGASVAPEKRAYSRDRLLASQAGRKGGFTTADRRDVGLPQDD